jgi:organic radical activating enzyme
MWTDINLNIPTKEIKNCCKRQSTKLSVNELKFLGKDSFTKNQMIVDDKKFMVDNNQLPGACYGCKMTWPNSLWKVWNVWKDKDWTADQLENLKSQDHVHQIEIMLGITCNQSCMYCTEFVSSMWADIKGIPITTDTEWEDQALANLYEYIESERYNDKNYIMYNFLGGEPFLELRIFEVVEKLIAIHRFKSIPNKKIIIHMTTNLNIKSKTLDRYLEIVEKNLDIEWGISASLDSIGRQGEEIRDGLIFSRFEENLEKIYASNKFRHVSILPSVSALSIPNKADLINWFLNLTKKYRNLSNFGHTFNIGQNIVTWPDAMHPGILTDNYKTEIDKCIQIIETLDRSNADTKKYLDHLNNLKQLIGTKRQPEYLNNAKEWYINQGKLKNKNYFDIFPFLNEIL